MMISPVISQVFPPIPLSVQEPRDRLAALFAFLVRAKAKRAAAWSARRSSPLGLRTHAPSFSSRAVSWHALVTHGGLEEGPLGVSVGSASEALTPDTGGLRGERRVSAVSMATLFAKCAV